MDHDDGNDADDPIGSFQQTVTQPPTLYGQAYRTRDYAITNSMPRYFGFVILFVGMFVFHIVKPFMFTFKS